MTVNCSLDTEKAMDSMLITRANSKGIPVLEVESAEFQSSLLNSFTRELYLLIVEDELKKTETADEELNALYSLWLSGDRDALWTYLAEEDEDDGTWTQAQKDLYEDYSYRLIDERNLGMRDKAEEYLKSGKTVFFAVGSAHMANAQGLVRLLTDAGYSVETVSY